MVSRSNKSQSFSDRDILVLYHLYEKVTLNIQQIHKLCFVGVKIFSAYKVVSRLKAAGLIRSFQYELGKAGRVGDIYLLTRAGFKVLKHNFPEYWIDETNYRDKNAPNLLSAIQHRMLIVDYWISLEMALAESEHYSLKLFVPEYKKLPNGRPITLRVVLQNGEPLQVRNDALFILTNNVLKRQYLFGLEVDRSTMPIQAGDPANSIMHEKLAPRSSIEDKLLKLHSVFSCGNQALINFGGELAKFSGMRLIFISTGTGSHIKFMLKQYKKMEQLVSKNIVIFTLFEELRTNNAFRCVYVHPDIAGGIKVSSLENFLVQ